MSISLKRPQVAENEVEFRRVGTVRVQSDDEGNDSESEKKAEKVNTAAKE